MKTIYQYTLILVVAFFAATGNSSAQSISSKTTLSIEIKGVPAIEQQRVSGKYGVDASGNIYMPMLKSGIRASGLSSSALARRIEAAYRAAQIYKNPRITVISTKDTAASSIDTLRVSVGGFVKRPGPIPFARGMTLFQAVAAAGGETAFGSIKRVELHRNGKKYTYDLRKSSHMNVKVYPGDTINVPQKTAWGN